MIKITDTDRELVENRKRFFMINCPVLEDEVSRRDLYEIQPPKGSGEQFMRLAGFGYRDEGEEPTLIVGVTEFIEGKRHLRLLEMLRGEIPARNTFVSYVLEWNQGNDFNSFDGSYSVMSILDATSVSETIFKWLPGLDEVDHQMSDDDKLVLLTQYTDKFDFALSEQLDYTRNRGTKLTNVNISNGWF